MILWDIVRKKTEHAFTQPWLWSDNPNLILRPSVYSASVSANGKWVALVVDETVQIWNIPDRRMLGYVGPRREMRDIDVEDVLTATWGAEAVAETSSEEKRKCLEWMYGKKCRNAFQRCLGAIVSTREELVFLRTQK